MKKCRFCFTRVDAAAAECRVCGIAYAAAPGELTPDEKKTAYCCRSLYTVGFVAIVSGGFGVFLALPMFFAASRRAPESVGISPRLLPYFAALMLGLSMLLPLFGFAVRRYKKWSRPLGIFLFASLAALHAVDGRYVLAGASLVFLYYVASARARAVLRA